MSSRFLPRRFALILSWHDGGFSVRSSLSRKKRRIKKTHINHQAKTNEKAERNKAGKNGKITCNSLNFRHTNKFQSRLSVRSKDFWNRIHDDHHCNTTPSPLKERGTSSDASSFSVVQWLNTNYFRDERLLWKCFGVYCSANDGLNSVDECLRKIVMSFGCRNSQVTRYSTVDMVKKKAIALCRRRRKSSLKNA